MYIAWQGMELIGPYGGSLSALQNQRICLATGISQLSSPIENSENIIFLMSYILSSSFTLCIVHSPDFIKFTSWKHYTDDTSLGLIWIAS